MTNLHGMPGILGGLAAILVIDGLDTSSQLSGIFITVVSALAFGFVTGKVLSLFGRRKEAYDDTEEFMDAEDEMELHPVVGLSEIIVKEQA